VRQIGLSASPATSLTRRHPPPLAPPLTSNDRRRCAMGQAPAPFPYLTIGPPAHGWLGWFGWDAHFGPKEQCSLLFLLRILFKSIQNFKPSKIHRNSNKFDKNINSIPLLNLPFYIE
jgi:hypothetical protein